jgi:hypothetical protein
VISVGAYRGVLKGIYTVVKVVDGFLGVPKGGGDPKGEGDLL